MIKRLPSTWWRQIQSRWEPSCSGPRTWWMCRVAPALEPCNYPSKLACAMFGVATTCRLQSDVTHRCYMTYMLPTHSLIRSLSLLEPGANSFFTWIFLVGVLWCCAFSYHAPYNWRVLHAQLFTAVGDGRSRQHKQDHVEALHKVASKLRRHPPMVVVPQLWTVFKIWFPLIRVYPSSLLQKWLIR